jgi:hypothetical protein
MERLYSFGRPISKTTALKLCSEAWVLKKRGEQRIKVTQMKFLGYLLGITKLERERNRSVRDKLGVQNFFREIRAGSAKVATTLRGMDRNRVPKQVLQYQTRGRKNIGYPRKRWKDQVYLED